MPKTKSKLKQTDKKVKVQKKAVTGLTIPVYDLNGKEKTKFTLPKEVFAVKTNPKLLAQYVRVYLANQRQGNAWTKTRGEVIGSTRKIYKQKGTGRARHGDKKAPIFVGGGIVGGPKPRNYSLKLNKKQTKSALLNALSLKFKEAGIFGLNDDFSKVEPKTKIFVNFLKVMGADKEKILLVLAKMEKNNLVLSSRNIPNLTLTEAASLNPYEILRNKKVFFLTEGLQVLVKNILKNEN